jgi:predicted Zn-dependent protease
LLLDPLSGPVVVANAKLDILQNQPETAKKRLAMLLDHESNDKEAIWMLAQLYSNEGNTQNAEALLKKLLSLTPENKLAKDLLAKINTTNI